MTTKLQPITPRNVADQMAPLHQQLLDLLAGLDQDSWRLPTVAGKWQVRDVAAHLLDTQLRSLSALRDGHSPPPASPIEGYRDLVRFLDQLNADWIQATQRLSPQVLLDLLTHVGSQAADLYTRLDPMAPALFTVDWAGESASSNWMHIGREYTEWWHHQMQIRAALDAASLLLEPRWFEPLLDFSMRALPHAYRSVAADPRTTMVVVIDSEVRAELSDDGNRRSDPWCWSLVKEPDQWSLWRGQAPEARTTLFLDGDTAWRSFYHALSPQQARQRSRVEGDTSLAEPFFRARSVMV